MNDHQAAAHPSQAVEKGSVALFCGLGNMGYPMAGHIARACAHNKPLTQCFVYTRNAAKSRAHAQEFGSVPVEDIDTLAFNPDQPCIAMFCLPTSKEVETLLHTLVPRLPSDSVVIDCTSGDQKTTLRIGGFLQTHRIAMLDAPVSGGPNGARNGQLSVMVGGDSSVFLRTDVQYALRSFSRPNAMFHMGKLGNAHAVKAVNSILNVSHLLLASEALCTLTRFGVDPQAALSAINASSGRSLMTEQRLTQEVLTRRFAYGGSLALMYKDVRNALSLFDEHFPEAEMVRVAGSMAERTVGEFGDDADETFLARFVERIAQCEMTPQAAAGSQPDSQLPASSAASSSSTS